MLEALLDVIDYKINNIIVTRGQFSSSYYIDDLCESGSVCRFTKNSRFQPYLNFWISNHYLMIRMTIQR